MYSLDQEYKWENLLPLVEFAHNNSSHAFVGIAPFEAIYGRKWRTPISWDSVKEIVVLRLDMLKSMEE